MKFPLLCALVALAALIAVGSAELIQTDDSHVAKAEDASVAIFAAPAPVNDDLETAKRALEAVRDFIEIFNSDIFAKVGKIKIVAEIVSKIFSFVISIINLIQGIGPQESEEMRFMREQFAEVNAKLDSISLQLNEVKRLIEWQTTRVMYANYESFIMATAHLLDSYASAPESSREVKKRQFITAFQTNPLASLKLYQAIVETEMVVASNLAVAVVHYTQNHRRHVMNFLLAMQRLIMRGAQIEIAYEKFVHGDHSARVTRETWDARMEKLLTRMSLVETEVTNKYHDQMETDIDRVILDNRHLSTHDFSGHMYNFLADKFDRRFWLSLAYNDVTGGHLHWLSYCGGALRFRTHGSRNVVIASADPKTTQFTQAKGNRALDLAQSQGHGTHAEAWTNLIRSKIGDYCEAAALVASVCWGCNVWFTVRSDRYSYRTMTNGGHIHTVVFG